MKKEHKLENNIKDNDLNQEKNICLKYTPISVKINSEKNEEKNTIKLNENSEIRTVTAVKLKRLGSRRQKKSQKNKISYFDSVINTFNSNLHKFDELDKILLGNSKKTISQIDLRQYVKKKKTIINEFSDKLVLNSYSEKLFSKKLNNYFSSSIENDLSSFEIIIQGEYDDDKLLMMIKNVLYQIQLLLYIKIDNKETRNLKCYSINQLKKSNILQIKIINTIIITIDRNFIENKENPIKMELVDLNYFWIYLSEFSRLDSVDENLINLEVLLNTNNNFYRFPTFKTILLKNEDNIYNNSSIRAKCLSSIGYSTKAVCFDLEYILDFQKTDNYEKFIKNFIADIINSKAEFPIINVILKSNKLSSKFDLSAFDNLQDLLKHKEYNFFTKKYVSKKIFCVSYTNSYVTKYENESSTCIQVEKTFFNGLYDYQNYYKLLFYLEKNKTLKRFKKSLKVHIAKFSRTIEFFKFNIGDSKKSDKFTSFILQKLENKGDLKLMFANKQYCPKFK